MMWWGNGFAPGWMWLWMGVGWLWFILFWGGIIALVIWLVRRFAAGSGERKEQMPLDIARARYARGEITREEFEQLKRALVT